MRNQGGFTYLAVLFLVAVLSIKLAASEVSRHSIWRHDQERELLFVGHQFRNAIGQYYEKTPGTVKRYPAKLEDLLLDKRYLPIQRYLRRIYIDPMTGLAKWGIVRAPDGGIMGVYSLSDKKAIKTANFGSQDRDFDGKKKYSDWKFIYVPVDVALAPVR